MLEEAGFRRVEIAARGGDLAVAFYKIQTACLRLSRPSGKNFSDLLSSLLAAPLLAPPFLLSTFFGQSLRRLRIGSEDDPLGYSASAYRP